RQRRPRSRSEAHTILVVKSLAAQRDGELVTHSQRCISGDAFPLRVRPGIRRAGAVLETVIAIHAEREPSSRLEDGDKVKDVALGVVVVFELRTADPIDYQAEGSDRCHRDLRAE